MGKSGAARGGVFQFHVMEREDLARFVGRLCAEKEVHAPGRKGRKFAFQRLNEVEDLVLDYDVTLLPPKKYFLPQRETLLRFEIGPPGTSTSDNSTSDGRTLDSGAKPAVRSVIEARGIVLFGVHPYDIVGLNLLDKVFADTHPDPNYLEKRARAVVIGLLPQRVSPYAFAGQMDAVRVREGFDLHFGLVNGRYVIAVGSDRGMDVLRDYGDSRPAHQADVALFHALEDEVSRKLTNWSARFRHEDLPRALGAGTKHSLWKENAERCLSCGSCNLVCPTCYCFDVQDEVALTLREGERYRMWDGCLLEDFAAVAGGENFREHRETRYRHRFLRKGKYVPERHGVVGCVGCGRCSTACLPDIANPIEVFNALADRRENRHETR